MKLYKCDACGEIITLTSQRYGSKIGSYDLCPACKEKEVKINPEKAWLDLIREGRDDSKDYDWEVTKACRS